MKVLIKNHIFSGGAPRSLLQYAKVLLDNGVEVVTAGEVTSDAIVDNYENSGIKLYNIQSFNRRNIFKNLLILFQFYKVILNEKPDIIITTDDLNASFCSLIGRYCNIKVIILRAGGKDPISNVLLPTWNDNQLIVFSEENREYFINQNYDSNKINLISNRISVDIDNSFKKIYRGLDNKEEMVKLLIISRLEEGKQESILTTYRITESLAKRFKNLQLIVAGSGNYEELLRSEASKINQKFNRELIKVLGHIDNVQDMILKSHLVFGKGRSVIEAIMLNRLGVVVGEDKKFSICTLERFNNLYKYNFAGRNIKVSSSIDEIHELICNLINNKYDFNNLLEVSNIAREKFDSRYLSDKLLPLIKKNDKKDSKYSFVKLRIIIEYLKIDMVLISDFIKRKIN